MGEAGYKLYERDRIGNAKTRPLAFSCDTEQLKAWLGKRKASLEAVRNEFESLWKDLRLYFEPNFGKALVATDARDSQAAKRDDEKILNSEPRLCVQRYGAGMQSGITNKAQPWLSIVPKLISEEEARDPELNEWCNTVTSEILSSLERANFYRTMQLVYPHAALFGTSCILVLRGEDRGDVHFYLIDEGDYWIAEDRYRNATTLMRRVSMTLGQASEEFLNSNLPETWRTKIRDGKLEERVEVWNLICPNDGNERFKDVDRSRPYVSVYWIENENNENHGILDISSFSYKPFAVLRQMDSGAAYGKGLGEMSLPDCKELQMLEQYLLRMIANEAEPSMIAPSSMKGQPINMFPGGVTYYDGIMSSGAAPVGRLFQTQEGIDKVDVKIQDIAARIAKIWYNDLFAMMLQVNATNKGQKTATEVSELSGEKVTLLGPVLTQMDEFLTSVIDGVFTILLEDGVVGDPPAVLLQGDADISVEYTSTIHAEMKAALKMRAINVLIEMCSMLAQPKPDTLDKIDADKIVDEVCRVYPGAAAYIKDAAEVAKIRDARTRQQQEAVANAQLVEIMKNAGANAKNLSEARVGNGNALDAITGGLA